jgi:hypothetical protein
MATVKELIEHLQTLPQDAVVEVLEANSWETVWETLSINDHVEVSDFRDNRAVHPTSKYYKKCIVSIGIK